jgi:hypothetical protein
MSPEEQQELEAILSRGHWSGTRFIPQPKDAARYHELFDQHSAAIYEQYLRGIEK